MTLPAVPYLLAVGIACHAGISLAATLQGTVVRVADGDTVTVADGRHRQVKVRLSGIDAPEKQQAFGRQAGANLARLVMGKPVAVEWDKRDAYGRIIGRVLVAPVSCPGCARTEDAGLAQIQSGYAWWYRSESRELSHTDQQRYAIAENAARASYRGLWADPKPVPPWQWRHDPANHSSSAQSNTTTHIRKVKTIIRHPLRNMQRWIHG